MPIHNAPAEPDLYQQWKTDQRAAQMAAQPGEEVFEPVKFDSQFSAGNEEPMEQMAVKSQFSVGNTPAAPDGTGMMAGAGIMAAGQTAGMIAQIAGQKAAQDAMVANNTAGRDLTEKMAKAALLQNSAQFNASAKMNAYSTMLSALASAGNNVSAQRSLSRNNARSDAAGMTTAYLG